MVAINSKPDISINIWGLPRFQHWKNLRPGGSRKPRPVDFGSLDIREDNSIGHCRRNPCKHEEFSILQWLPGIQSAIFTGVFLVNFFSVKWRLIRTPLHWHKGLTPDFNNEKTYDREGPENRARLIPEVWTSGKTIQLVIAVGTRVNRTNFRF